MSQQLRFFLRAVGACAAVFTLGGFCHAQIGYGVDANFELFSFDVNSPATATTIGNLGFLPEGIDFKPGTRQLYAIDVGAVNTNLYTVSITNGAATLVGGFPSNGGASYNLTGNKKFGFDFNPKTLQADLSTVFIRLVSTDNTNMRIRSDTGAIVAVDTPLAIGSNSPFVDAAAYINNIPTQGGVTGLYDMDSRNNALYKQDPPNSGALNLVGPFGVTINNAESGIQFDIYTTPGSVDDTIGGDFGYAVLKRPDAPIGGPLGAYLLYDVNLGTGAIGNGRRVGPAATPRDFTGGLAVIPIVPEPTSLVIFAIGLGALAGVRRRGELL